VTPLLLSPPYLQRGSEGNPRTSWMSLNDLDGLKHIPDLTIRATHSEDMNLIDTILITLLLRRLMSFWDLKPSIMVDIGKRFGEIYCFNLQCLCSEVGNSRFIFATVGK
jgi:hypothetical protein